MRLRIKKILIGFVLSLFLCVSSFAQNKIAIIDSNVFYDEKRGIRELFDVMKDLKEEFKSDIEKIKVLNEKNEKLFSHLQNHRFVEYIETEQESDNEIIELQSLQKNLKSLIEEFNPRIQKRRNELAEPINKRIAEKLEKFRKNNGYKKIFDISKVIMKNENLPNVTSKLIKFCNEEFEKEKAAK